MSVSNILKSLFNAKALSLVLIVFSLVLTGCGASSETESPVLVSSVAPDSGDDTNTDTGNNPDPNPAPDDARILNLLAQPSNATINDGQSQTFSVTVEHNNPITVTWYLNDSVFQTSANTSVSVSAAGTYGCSITDGELTEQCDSFTLTVNAVQFVTITDQPANQMVNEGVDVTLSVEAVGSGSLSYQWYFNGSAISGGTSSDLVLGSVTAGDDGNYYCVVSNNSLSATSSTVSVDVAPNLTGRAYLTWGRPLKRADNSDLAANEIESYEIYYTDTDGGVMAPLDLVGSDEYSYTKDGLSDGTHYFALVTVDSDGLKSALSDVIEVTIN
jgi:hypothetical protein